MNKMKRYKNGKFDPVSIQAKDWLLQIKSKTMTPEDEVEFYAWLVEHPKHKEQFDLANAVWEVSDVLKEDEEILAVQNEMAGKGALSGRKWADFFRPRFSLVPAMAAAFVLVLAAALWLSRPGGHYQTTYSTGTGAQETVYLSDGSTVVLDTETEISLSYTKAMRQIELIKGRASFTVAKEHDRPFMVTVGEVAVCALGTVFNVYKADTDKISVTVTEGKVAITRKPEKPLELKNEVTSLIKAQDKPVPSPLNQTMQEAPKPLALNVVSSGQEALISHEKKEYKVKPIDIKSANTWREGRLCFYNTPLSEVIGEINRYLDSKIVIRDSEIQTITISMNYDIRRQKRFLPTLEKVIPIYHVQDEDGTISLYGKGKDNTKRF